MEQQVKLSKQEQKLFEIIRNTASGEVRIIMKEGQPIRAEQIQKDIALEQTESDI